MITTEISPPRSGFLQKKFSPIQCQGRVYNSFWALKIKVFPVVFEQNECVHRFYVQFWVRNDLAGCLGVDLTSSKPRREVRDFRFFFSDLMAIFGYSLASLNVLKSEITRFGDARPWIRTAHNNSKFDIKDNLLQRCAFFCAVAPVEKKLLEERVIKFIKKAGYQNIPKLKILYKNVNCVCVCTCELRSMLIQFDLILILWVKFFKSLVKFILWCWLPTGRQKYLGVILV